MCACILRDGSTQSVSKVTCHRARTANCQSFAKNIFFHTAIYIFKELDKELAYKKLKTSNSAVLNTPSCMQCLRLLFSCDLSGVQPLKRAYFRIFRIRSKTERTSVSSV